MRPVDRRLILFRTIIAFLLLTAAHQSLAQEGYALAPGDVVEISVWKEEGLQREVLVRPDGRLSFPLAGHVHAAGRTPEAVESEIRERLSAYIPEPVVTVSVLQVAGNKIYVIGKVTRPGEYVIGQYVDVMQALTLAGGLTPFASANNIKILRRHEGGTSVHRFKYGQAEKGEQLKQNIMLQAGDVVVVP